MSECVYLHKYCLKGNLQAIILFVFLKIQFVNLSSNSLKLFLFKFWKLIILTIKLFHVCLSDFYPEGHRLMVTW